MINLKSDEEIKIMVEGGKILSDICAELISRIKPGITGIEIDKEAESLVKNFGGTPSFQRIKGYKNATCICLNDTVVHGIPNKQPFINGDIVGIDIGIFYKGFNNDMSWTVMVGNKINPINSDFLLTGQKALEKGIAQAKTGNYIGHISKAIEDTLKEKRYNPVKILVGHGIGRNLHEDPQIPGFLNKKIIKTPKIEKGMVLAIEIIYSQGDGKVVYKNEDGWTIVTRDGSLAGLFEHTVAILEDREIVLTRSDKFDKMVQQKTHDLAS